ncbi:serine/threonine-protein phosphatase 7 long form homolog [Rutidosis leptorrhynchoides]|uniref:serine/threonine-protein phosphatase 7 long form homolog n=1 Tax=Rutidosis leptorrhynchoides TaxID=125765 RepID=UPI003A9A36D0
MASGGYICWLEETPSQWKKWVDHLTTKFEPLWRKVGIIEAIITSTFNIRKDFNLVLNLAERWNLSTNTFVFPWGEATVTLEDMIILGGYSCVNGYGLVSPLLPVTDNLKQIEKSIKEEDPKEQGDVNFKGVIHDCVFPIAVRLARGMRFAFAPAVLASIYRDLSKLKNAIVACNDFMPGECKSKRKLEVTLYSPIQLVQLWAWEGFLDLEAIPASVSFGEPRAARWDNVKFHKLDNVRVALDCAKNSFRWRPYAISVSNWEFPKFY